MKTESVIVSYNNHNETFDVFSDENCIYYGDPDQVQEWLSENGYEQIGPSNIWEKTHDNENNPPAEGQHVRCMQRS